jgi:hypothetical protein
MAPSPFLRYVQNLSAFDLHDLLVGRDDKLSPEMKAALQAELLRRNLTLEQLREAAKADLEVFRKEHARKEALPLSMGGKISALLLPAPVSWVIALLLRRKGHTRQARAMALLSLLSVLLWGLGAFALLLWQGLSRWDSLMAQP